MIYAPAAATAVLAFLSLSIAAELVKRLIVAWQARTVELD